jgi:Glycosyltransferase 61
MTSNLQPSSSPLSVNHRPSLLQKNSKQIYQHGEFCYCLQCRRSNRKNRMVFIVAFLVVISVLLGRNFSLHQSTLTDIQDDFHFVSHLIEDAKTNVAGTNINNETDLWNDSFRAPTPPAPWPTESDGCNAEDGTRPYCQFHYFLIDLSRVNSVAIGGEPLVLSDHNNETRDVMGQAEEDEYLYYQPGAFQSFTARKTVFPTDQDTSKFFYVNDVLNSLQVMAINDTSPIDWNCTHFFPGTTLFIQRYEYVNLYHTLTDWWNTWTVYRFFQQNEIAKVAVVFLDAHPAGNLDPVWTALFGESVHLRRLDDSNYIHSKQTAHLCFERAMLVPPGYISLLWPSRVPEGGLQLDPRTHDMMKEFVDFVLDKLNLTHVVKIPGNVVIIDRKPYLAHPRSQLFDDRSLNNFPEVADALIQNIPNITSVRILQLHNITFREQVEAIREAEVLVGVHGAGLTHLIFLEDGSHVVEFQMNLDFFVHLAQCKKGKVTLHQIPFISESISESFLKETFLPAFSRIYGQRSSGF